MRMLTFINVFISVSLWANVDPQELKNAIKVKHICVHPSGVEVVITHNRENGQLALDGKLPHGTDRLKVSVISESYLLAHDGRLLFTYILEDSTGIQLNYFPKVDKSGVIYLDGDEYGDVSGYYCAVQLTQKASN